MVYGLPSSEIECVSCRVRAPNCLADGSLGGTPAVRVGRRACRTLIVPCFGAFGVDEVFRHPRLAAICDAVDSDRSDLEAYVALVNQLGARSVLDVGRGTGLMAVMPAVCRSDIPSSRPVGLQVSRGRIRCPPDR